MDSIFLIFFNVLMKKQLPVVFLKLSQNLQDNTCVSVLFSIKLQAWGVQLYEEETPTQVFSC